MKIIFRSTLLLSLFLISSFCSAQMFSVNELIKLTGEDNKDFRNYVVERGYSNENAIDNGLSRSFEYSTMSGNSIISLVIPSFKSDVKMITWDFRSPAVFDELKSQLEMANFRLTNTERRKAGKYLSLCYSRLGYDIILTADKTMNPSGKYIFSVKTSKDVKMVDNNIMW